VDVAPPEVLLPPPLDDLWLLPPQAATSSAISPTPINAMKLRALPRIYLLLRPD
jgi:hypothetical protein